MVEVWQIRVCRGKRSRPSARSARLEYATQLRKPCDYDPAMEPHLIEGDHGYGVVGSQYVGEPENVSEPGDYVFTLKREPLGAYDSTPCRCTWAASRWTFLRAPAFPATTSALRVAATTRRAMRTDAR